MVTTISRAQTDKHKGQSEEESEAIEPQLTVTPHTRPTCRPHTHSAHDGLYAQAKEPTCAKRASPSVRAILPPVVSPRQTSRRSHRTH
eukprot:3866004-Prymnesium_polylepis.1